jgi:hypothetical protein
MSYEYYVLYDPERKKELEIRYDKDFDKWEFNWGNPGGPDKWSKFDDHLLPQIESHIKKYGYKMPRYIFSEEEYRAALKRAEKLEHELNGLVDVIKTYENKHYPMGE